METTDIAPALQERLGPDATAGLCDLFDNARREWMADVTTAAVERFDRRLTDEISGLRLELRQEIRDGDAAVREELRRVEAGLRNEIRDAAATHAKSMNELGASLRLEMSALGAALRKEMGDLRVELLKWSFAFWVGQLLTLAAIAGVIFRISG